MEYLEYFINALYNGIEEFFKSFTMVSGKATLRVLYFSIGYLFVALVSKITGYFTFLNIWSALSAVIVLVLINCISVIQIKDINKFKKLLKGDNDDYE